MDRSAFMGQDGNGYGGSSLSRVRRQTMRVKTTIAVCLAAMLGVLAVVLQGLAAAPAWASEAARQPVAMHLSFDRPLDASMAPFVLAQSRGVFAGEGLAVTTDAAQ